MYLLGVGITCGAAFSSRESAEHDIAPGVPHYDTAIVHRIRYHIGPVGRRRRGIMRGKEISLLFVVFREKAVFAVKQPSRGGGGGLGHILTNTGM